MFYILGKYANTVCGSPASQPTGVSAMPTGAYQVTLRWFKPLLDTYDFDVSYQPSGKPEAAISATNSTAFGPIFSYQAYDLLNQTKYEFSLKQFCKGEPNTASSIAPASTTTLDAGMCLTHY